MLPLRSTSTLEGKTVIWLSKGATLPQAIKEEGTWAGIQLMKPSVPCCGDKTLVQCIDAGWALADAGVESWPFSSLFGMPAGSQQFPCAPIPNLWSAQSGVGGKSGRSLWPSEIVRALGL